MAEEEHWMDREAKGAVHEVIVAVGIVLFTVAFILSIPVRLYRWASGWF